MKPTDIKKLRESLGENTDAFAGRFSRSGRTVEEWEQGRRNPDPLVIAKMAWIAAKMARKNLSKIS